MAKRAVIGQQQHALGIQVQSADGIEASGQVGDKLGHGGPSPGVGHRAQVPGGLVEKHVEFLLDFNALAVDLDDVALGIDFRSEFLSVPAVDSHAAGSHQLFASPAGSHSGKRKKML